MSHIAVFEPIGLAHADRVALALMRLERNSSGAPVTLLHLDPNLRGLCPSPSGQAWPGLANTGLSLASALIDIANGRTPTLTAAPLGAEGQMIFPGPLLEEAWDEASQAVLRTAHTRSLREPLLAAIRAINPASSWVSLLGPARRGPAAFMLAEATVLVICWTGGISANGLDLGQLEVLKRLRELRGGQSIPVIGLRIAASGDASTYWHLLSEAVGRQFALPPCNLLDPDPTIEAIVAALRPTWLRIHGLAP
jgi:hypothetical protein